MDLTQEITNIDKEAETRGDEWLRRYDLQRKLEHVYHLEEAYWQQRVGDRWTVDGDLSIGFFHQFANGRRRKNAIVTLDSDQGEVKG